MVDKNGRQTHVWKKDESSAVHSRRESSSYPDFYLTPPIHVEPYDAADKEAIWSSVHHIVSDGGLEYEKVMGLLEKYEVLYGTPHVGRTRAVFERGDGYVVKVAISDEGFYANLMEVQASSSSDNSYIPMARTSFADEDEYNSVVVAEQVVPIKLDFKKLPDWVQSVDGGQVGYTRDGRLVAYDL